MKNKLASLLVPFEKAHNEQVYVREQKNAKNAWILCILDSNKQLKTSHTRALDIALLLTCSEWEIGIPTISWSRRAVR